MFEGFDGWLRAGGSDADAEKPYSVSELIARCNFTLERELGDVTVEGEVAGFKVNQGKWVFFDLKEGDSSVGCFMTLRQLTIALEDGMKIRVQATPKLTRWGKFSLTVQKIIPVGEGNIKKSFELLKKKLAAEGLFAPERKRPLPDKIQKVGVISSTGAAGYADFLKILNNRWGGLEIQTINTQVQGLVAPAQIIRALECFNQRGNVDILVIIRGGGSADDLAAFNDEALARAIASSKIPVLTGIGHEVDESLADLVADIRASTPSNAAERLVPDRQAVKIQLGTKVQNIKRFLRDRIETESMQNLSKIKELKQQIIRKIELLESHILETKKVLQSLNPEEVLRRGYAIVAGHTRDGNKNYQVGEEIELITQEQNITAEVKSTKSRL